MSAFNTSLSIVLACGCMTIADLAMAVELTPPEVPVTEAPAEVSASPAASQDPAPKLEPALDSPDGAVVPDTELVLNRGREKLVVANQSMTAVTAGNELTGGYTAGNVEISDNALANFTGFGNILINTGAQVSLQSGMNVTLNLGE